MGTLLSCSRFPVPPPLDTTSLHLKVPPSLLRRAPRLPIQHTSPSPNVGTTTTLLEKQNVHLQHRWPDSLPARPAMEVLMLPFQFSMRLAHDITHRNFLCWRSRPCMFCVTLSLLFFFTNDSTDSVEDQ